MINHLITHIILEKKFPQILKISRITPGHKTGKPIYDIESFRPITIEKIIEDYIKLHFEMFLEENKIINPNHHGGRKDFSTTTALTQILLQLEKIMKMIMLSQF